MHEENLMQLIDGDIVSDIVSETDPKDAIKEVIKEAIKEVIQEETDLLGDVRTDEKPDCYTSRGILVVVSGFAGAGKGTLVRKLVEAHSDYYALSVSMTTREPRPGEIDGVSYFFVNEAEFRKRIDDGGLIEYAEYCENFYGTPRDFVEQQLEKGKNVILEIEVQGAKKIRYQFEDSLLVFVTPPNLTELERRLRGRGTETEDQIFKRLTRARDEVREIEDYDFVIINDEVEEAVEALHRAVKAAHSDPRRNVEFIASFRNALDYKYKRKYEKR